MVKINRVVMNIKFNLYQNLVFNTSWFSSSSILSTVSPNNNYNKINWKIRI